MLTFNGPWCFKLTTRKIIHWEFHSFFLPNESSSSSDVDVDKPGILLLLDEHEDDDTSEITFDFFLSKISYPTIA